MTYAVSPIAHAMWTACGRYQPGIYVQVEYLAGGSKYIGPYIASLRTAASVQSKA